ncbi:MAG: (Fe-S)-binding protein [Anaerolineae bacterium]
MPTLDLRPFTFMQLMELDACTRCGECIKWCPTFAEKELDPITPLHKIEAVRRFVGEQYGLRARLFGARPLAEAVLEQHATGTYDCTLCGRCHVVCPVRIETRRLWIAMREQLVALGRYPSIFNGLRDRVSEAHNISGEANENRLFWSQNLERVPEGLVGREGAEVVYFVGCVAAFYPMVYGVPQAFARILDQVGVDFTTLGGEEWCCGFPLIIAGMGHSTEELIRHNVEAVRALGARTLVVTCPSCYHTWRDDYPRLLGEPLGFQVRHSTELLTDLIRAGAIELKGFDGMVTYHDPCDLGRTSGIYEAPRQIIQGIPGLSFAEMADNREHALCCGGGGDMEMADAELTAAVARRRLEQAQATGARYVVTACQQCKRTLSTAARRERMRLRVLDVAELVWQAMEVRR